MKATLIFLLALAVAQCYEENPYYKPIRACGANLARTLHEVCLPDTKRYVARPRADTISDVCCSQECDIATLRQYCYMASDPRYND